MQSNAASAVNAERERGENDAAPITSYEGIPNDEIRNSGDVACLFGISASSFVIRASAFSSYLSVVAVAR
jgi:hypothetical protein